MTTTKDKQAVISRFERSLKEHGFARQPLNRYAEQWAADGLIQSYGLNTVYEVMEYYFKVNKNPQWRYFAVKFGDILKAKTLLEEDTVIRAKYRQQMRELLNES